MKVYIVVSDNQQEFDPLDDYCNIEAVFDSKEKAEAYIAEHAPTGSYTWHDDELGRTFTTRLNINEHIVQ